MNDANGPPMIDPLYNLHDGIPRAGPGSDATTRKAIARLPSLPPSPCIVDIGCGPGRQTLVLARTLAAPVIAIDIHQPFLDRLGTAAADAGLADLIETRNMSMDALEFPPASIDLIWCEGAVFIMGVERSLRLWQGLLRRRALLAFTEATWLSDERPPEAAAYWSEEYPKMATVTGNSAVIGAEGYEVLDTFVLPAEDWWTEYYGPLSERIAALRPAAVAEPELAAVLDLTEREISLYSRHGDSFGYVFYLARKAASR